MKAFVLAGFAIGCGGSDTSKVRWTHVEDVAPLERVVVYEHVQDSARVGIFFRGFDKHLIETLEACAIPTTVHRGLPAGAASTPPETTLTITPDGGTVTQVKRVNQYGGVIDEDHTVQIDGAFKLELFDVRANKVTWRAVVDVKTETTPDQGDGTAFAEVVLARLRADGVLACRS